MSEFIRSKQHDGGRHVWCRTCYNTIRREGWNFSVQHAHMSESARRVAASRGVLA